MSSAPVELELVIVNEIERQIMLACTILTDDLEGTYRKLSFLTEEQQEKLKEHHSLVKEGYRFLEAANSTSHWPEGRGMFYNNDKTFFIWTNEEDQVRLISKQEGGNLAEIF